MRTTTPLRHPFTAPAAALAALLAPCALALADPVADGAPSSAVVPLSPEAQASLSGLLNFDPCNAASPTMPRSPLRTRSGVSGHALDWNRNEKLDGSSAVSVKKQLPTAWDAKVGADFGFGAPPAIGTQPLPLVKEQNSSAAWANVTVPGVASINARVEPSQEQNKLGTTFSRSLPLGSQYSVTLQNSYAVTETLGGPTVPAITGTGAAAAPSQVWSTDRLVKFNILSTGTSLAAGTTSSSIDSVTRNKLSAEQKLFDKFNVTTSVTDVGAASSNKSVTAGFKWKW